MSLAEIVGIRILGQAAEWYPDASRQALLLDRCVDARACGLTEHDQLSEHFSLNC